MRGLGWVLGVVDFGVMVGGLVAGWRVENGREKGENGGEREEG